MFNLTEKWCTSFWLEFKCLWDFFLFKNREQMDGAAVMWPFAITYSPFDLSDHLASRTWYLHEWSMDSAQEI